MGAGGCGLGVLVQMGGQLTDVLLVLRTFSAVKAFCGRAHLGVGASLSATAGPLGRAAEVYLRAGDGGAAACYSYSCTKGELPPVTPPAADQSGGVERGGGVTGSKFTMMTRAAMMVMMTTMMTMMMMMMMMSASVLAA